MLGVQSQASTAAISQLQTPRSRMYVTQNLLGSGGFAQVYKVFDTSTGKTYAMKEFFINGNNKRQEWTRRLIEKEVTILRGVNHVRNIPIDL